MSDTLYNVLFLCSGNSCRSIMAASILNRIGQGRFSAYSAGSHPSGSVNPHTLALLTRFEHPIADLRSKSWDEFCGENAPTMDFVISVCDQAAGEACPVWPGKPVTTHWDFPDPAKFEGTEAETRAFFTEIYGRINNTLSVFVNLPLEKLDTETLRRKLADLSELSSDN
ncbi:MAG: arsenate reductase ArsC [Acidiferrobacterales bacterium]